MNRDIIAQELLKVAKELVASKTYSISHNGLKIHAERSEMKEVVKDLDEITDKLTPTDDYEPVGYKGSRYEWQWMGLFGTASSVVNELKKRGYTKES
jgi:hypothetical protein